jgi:hypothetical protein
MRKSNKGSPQRRMKQRNQHMHKLSTPAHPFQFNIQPWFSLTVRLTSLTTSLSIQGLRLAMISQLGLNFTGASDSTFDVRLQRAYFWGGLLPMNSASVLQPLTVTVRDLFITIGNDSGFPDLNSLNVLEQYADYPNQVSRAKLGFEYSDAHKQAVIPADIANTSSFSTFQEWAQTPSCIFNFFGGLRQRRQPTSFLPQGWRLQQRHRTTTQNLSPSV